MLCTAKITIEDLPHQVKNFLVHNFVYHPASISTSFLRDITITHTIAHETSIDKKPP